MAGCDKALPGLAIDVYCGIYGTVSATRCERIGHLGEFVSVSVSGLGCFNSVGGCMQLDAHVDAIAWWKRTWTS